MPPTSGASDAAASEVKSVKRDKVPNDRIAAICRPMTKPAPVIAAKTCAISRVRPGPKARNSPTVTAMATAVADSPTAMTTP